MASFFSLPRLAITVAVLLISGTTLYFFLKEPFQKLHLLPDRDMPSFTDDADIESLIDAAGKQLDYLAKQDPEKLIEFNTASYPVHHLQNSLQSFLKAIEAAPQLADLDAFLKKNYSVYQAGGRQKKRGRQMLVTGYYEPVFQGSLKKEPPFLYPLYSTPASLIKQDTTDGKKKTGRLDEQNKLIDYWSRAEIENNNLCAGYEIAYLKDPFDAYLLHVQGSGKVLLPDKTLLAVRFAASNGLEYKSIGKLLVDTKIMKLEEVSIPAIRDYLDTHPERMKSVLQHNPRFIFFQVGDNLAPRGSSGVRLTAGRSIAIDWSSLPGGTLAYLITRRPEVDETGEVTGWVAMRRFVFPQDSGSAIEGAGRVDFFWGSGDYARTAANHMKEEGLLYFLVEKER